MALPAVLAPKRLLPDLPSILSGTGATVAEEPVPEELIKRGFIAKFNCTLDDGETVCVECHKIPEDNETIILVLHALRGRRRKVLSLLTRLESALKQHAATDIRGQEEKP